MDQKLADAISYIVVNDMKDVPDSLKELVNFGRKLLKLLCAIAQLDILSTPSNITRQASAKAHVMIADMKKTHPVLVQAIIKEYKKILKSDCEARKKQSEIILGIKKDTYDCVDSGVYKQAQATLDRCDSYLKYLLDQE